MKLHAIFSLRKEFYKRWGAASLVKYEVFWLFSFGYYTNSSITNLNFTKSILNVFYSVNVLSHERSQHATAIWDYSKAVIYGVSSSDMWDLVILRDMCALRISSCRRILTWSSGGTASQNIYSVYEVFFSSFCDECLLLHVRVHVYMPPRSTRILSRRMCLPLQDQNVLPEMLRTSGPTHYRP
jgi:hypothetical protein